jgi:uncharacterized protein (TIGR00159 family)
MDLSWIEGIARLLDWRAPLEIALIGLGLFYLYRNLRVMGAWKIVVGILIGIGVFAGARLLELRGIEWILSHFVGVALLGLIVLFQPEIRRIFERTASFRRPRGAGGNPQLSALLADVLFDLARRKWGALIVVPGRESLTPWASSGIPLHADASFPLLVSLFDPNSPGHDGAVVLDEDRLASFGVRLPLSSKGKLSQEFGTRHHAALGLSESTDALTLVVSEERQSVSAFQGGRYHSAGNKEKIVEILERHWARMSGETPAGDRRGVRRFLSVPLLGSLLVASLFWLSLVPEFGEELEMSLSVPVEYTATPANVGIGGERVERVRVLVSGAASALSRLDPSALRVRADLSSAVPGRQRVPVSLGEPGLPRGIRLVEIEPAGFDLELFRLVERAVPIRPQLLGSLPDGLVLQSVEILPSAVRVRVREDGVGNPAEIFTAPIHLSGVSGSTRVISALVVPSGVRPVGGQWPGVTVILTVASSGVNS